MRSFLHIAFAFLILLAATVHARAPSDTVTYGGSFPAATTSGFAAVTLTLDGQPRDLMLYRPAGAQPQPLLIFFSGTGATTDYNLSDEIGREALRDFADEQNLILAFPVPRTLARGDWDNHFAGTPYWETATEEGIGSPVSGNPDTNPDLLFTRAIIKEAGIAYGADLSRVYLNGFSNGAFFSYFAATALSDRIAAFAESGGGLVLSNTTAGQPPCVTMPYAGSSGESRSCAAAGWTPGMCVAPAAIARPIAPTLARRIPPAYLEANDNDDSVPFAHTCNLSASLPDATPRQTRIMHTGNGHALNAGYLLGSWNFMRQYRLPYQGLWWNPAESGWGLSIAQHDATIFAALYTYDQAALPVWYVMSDCALQANRCSGEIYRVAGGSAPTVPWNGSTKEIVKAGDATIDFADASNATLNFNLGGVAGTRSISRQIFASGGVPAVDYTDLWWNPAESGWGVALTHQQDVIFLSWYTYGENGQPRWYVASNCAMHGSGCNGDLYEVSGGTALTAPWDGAHKMTSKVGTVTLVFSDSDNGRMDYTIHDVAASRSITRQGF